MAGVAILYACQKKKQDVGKLCDFSDSTPSVLVDVQPDLKQQSEYKQSIQSEYEGSNVSVISESGTNTVRKSTMTHGQLHLEGCWPKDVDIRDIGHRLRYRKKSEKDDTYFPSLKTLVNLSKTVLRQNNSIDIYQQYFKEYKPPPKRRNKINYSDDEDPLQVVTVLGDPLTGNMKTGRIPTSRIQRTACALAWQPVEGPHGRRIAVAYSSIRFPYVSSSALQPGESLSSYVWDLTTNSTPEITLNPSSQLSAIEFNSKDLHLLGGGCHNGTICCFDCRRGGNPVISTQLFGDNAPTSTLGGGAVRGLKWLQSSGRGQELLVIDGSNVCRIWDIRHMKEPVDSILVSRNQQKQEEAISLDCETANKFIIGTMTGSVYSCNRKGKSAGDHLQHEGHHGPVYNVVCNPLIPKVFLSVGDWAVRIWNEDFNRPLITTRYANTHMVDANWHPLHPGVFVSTLLNGQLEIRNLTHRMCEPLVTTQVSNEYLHCSKVHPEGEKIAVGSGTGQTYIVKMSLDLLNSNALCAEPLDLAKEKDFVEEIFRREIKREKSIRTRAAPVEVFEPPPCRPPPTEAELRDLTAMFISYAFYYYIYKGGRL